MILTNTTHDPACMCFDCVHLWVYLCLANVKDTCCQSWSRVYVGHTPSTFIVRYVYINSLTSNIFIEMYKPSILY